MWVAWFDLMFVLAVIAAYRARYYPLAGPLMMLSACLFGMGALVANVTA